MKRRDGKKHYLKRKVPVAIIGSGNIGSDLLVKILRSEILSCGLFVGQNPDSPGLARARNMGIFASHDSINDLIKYADRYEIVFDATTAQAHLQHAPQLAKLGKFTIDMTPSRIGKMCSPLINLEECLKESNINMISCGGQATTPVIAAIMRVHPDTDYVEVVSSIASKSAGLGTRDNIDEYTQTTCDAVVALAGAPRAKTIVILNPAEPPIIMHNTIYARIPKPDIAALDKAIRQVVARLQEFVPGYKLTVAPVEENNRVTIMTEVVGRGDWLPVFAGNLDIINCTAVNVAESYAQYRR